MKNTLIVIALLFVACPLAADYVVFDRGDWPNDWPKELESLRDHATTLEGPRQSSRHYGIPFTKREEFEAAWPYILKVKSEGAPIVLRRGSMFWLDDMQRGICIHTPPKGTKPVENKDLKSIRLMDSNYLELIVDGEIIDLNRIPIPPDTPIIDKRFEDADQKTKRK